MKPYERYYEDGPRAVEISVGNNCNLRCSFCGCHNAKDWGTKDLMTWETFTNIVDQLTPATKTLEIGSRSEPTMHPELVSFVRYAREACPWIQLTVLSNGVNLLRDLAKVFQLYRAGLNYIYLDSYSVEGTAKWQVLLKKYNALFHANGIIKEWSHIAKKHPWSYNGGKDRYFWLVDETQFARRGNRQFHTMGGNTPESEWQVSKESFPYMKPCIQTFYLMTINWDGTVEKCCASWDKKVTHGTIHDRTIKEIWTSDKWKQVQFLLKKGRRDLVPGCYYCNMKSFRAHWYPYVGPEFKEEKMK